MEGKVIIIGANQGALALAEFLGKNGLAVELFEKCKKEDVSYDWHDDMAPSTFERIGVPMPPKDIYFTKANWTFVSPDKGSYTFVDVPEDKRDITIDRKGLTKYFVERSMPYCTVNYECKVDSAIVEGKRIVGVVTADGVKHTADLVVDCAGANSCVREGLPESLMIQRKLNTKDAFIAFRAFYDRRVDAPEPKYTNKVYMKHLKEQGISWCVLEPHTGETNMLVGRVGQLTDENLQIALKDMRDENTFVGDKILHGGHVSCIPVRHPISRFVADGYALLGDSAFMTIPMMGSGIAAGLVAAKILSEVILQPEGEFNSIANLYRYQVQYMKEVGAKNAGVDLLKGWLLNASADDVAFLFNRGVISECDLSAAGSGQSIKLGGKELLSKIKKGISRIPLLLNLKSTMAKIDKETALAAAMPEKYDEAAFCQWQKQYVAPFGDTI